MRDIRPYNAVLDAIAHGASKLSEIASAAGNSTSLTVSHLSNLEELGIVRKVGRYGHKHDRKSIHQFADHAFRFWYRFVPQNISLIELDEPGPVLADVLPALPHFLAPVFEDICRQYLWDQFLAGALPCTIRQLGKWWGSDPVTKKQVEIDIAGGDGNDFLLLGECQWRNELVSRGVLCALLEKRHLFREPDCLFTVFSKSGFAPECIELASSRKDVRLVSYSQMLADWR